MPVNALVALKVFRPGVYLSPLMPLPPLARVLATKGELIKVSWVSARKGELDGWYEAKDFGLYN
jgi:hypothetical protein